MLQEERSIHLWLTPSEAATLKRALEMFENHASRQIDTSVDVRTQQFWQEKFNQSLVVKTRLDLFHNRKKPA